MKEPISITALASISPLGLSKEETWASYGNDSHCFQERSFGDAQEWIAPLSEAAQKEIEQLRGSDPKYQKLDDTVLFALYASRKAVIQAGWSAEDSFRTVAKSVPAAGSGNGPDQDATFGINIGSSRGATYLFEKYHEEFLRDHRASTLTSPTTTLGNISSWVAHDLQTHGPEISHSITCSTALHALLNGVAWIQSGMTDRFLVGGSEAPLTPFTIAQMKALKIYAKSNAHRSVKSNAHSNTHRSVKSYVNPGELALDRDHAHPPKNPTDPGQDENTIKSHNPNLSATTEFPCQALNLDKKRNGMVLGEGASVACLEKGVPENALAVIEGIGYATEPLRHNTSISTDAQCFQRSMQMALKDTKPETVDAIVMHAPGTVKGDLSEYRAIQKVFGNKTPGLTTNKWKLGHTFGASGMLSVEMALLMLRHQQFIAVPFIEYVRTPRKLEKILVNAVGFGGNAVTILLNKV